MAEGYHDYRGGRGRGRGWRRGGQGHHGYGQRDYDADDNGQYGNYGNGHGRYGDNRERREEPGQNERGHYRGRGRRGGRGKRGHQDDSNDGDRPRPPPGLKGREIGMWYAARSKKKTKDHELQNRTFIQMDKTKEDEMTNLLHTIRSEDNIESQLKQPDQDLSHLEQQPQKTLPSQTFDFNRDFVSFSFDELSGESQSEAESQSQAGPSRDNTFTKSQWNTEEDILSDDEDISDDLMAKIAVDEEEYTSQAADVDQPITELYKNDDVESDFMTEFYRNKLANRRSYDRLQDIDTDHKSLQRLPQLDKYMLEGKRDKERNNQKYKNMLKFRKKLPSYNMQQEILEVISCNQVTVLSGETGCGKTTQVAQFILDDYIERGDGSLCRIGCTQPRRISAITVAERVADERAEGCGAESVGYQIRLEHKRPRDQGSILYCTTGIMLKWLVSDPWLSQMSHVILDEIHERDLHSDFLMIILKDLIQRRPDLKLVLMSATLNAEMFSAYFGNCPMLNIPGFTYPVKEYLLEDVIELTRYMHHDPPHPKLPRVFGKSKAELYALKHEHEEYVRSLRGEYSPATLEVLKGLDMFEIDLELVRHLIADIHLHKGDGAILVFLPGWDQISKLNGMLTKDHLFSDRSCRIIPLHSLMPTINQKQVFERPPQGIRKIVIATNIAETSITIDDVVFVIDCGKIKMKNFDPSNNITTLQPEWVSRANAKQRRGRAGRVQPGECYHLYTAHQETKFKDYQLPEILRTRLEELCLQIKLLKLGCIEQFVMKAMQTPQKESLHLAINNLRNLNALDGGEELTPLGYHLAKMPVDPHTGKMLLFAAMFCCLDPILTVAASLSFKDAFYIPLGKEKIADERRHRLSENSKSDHIMLANAFKGWERACSRGTSQQYCYDNFMSLNTLKMLKNMRKQFTELLSDMKFIESSNPKDELTNKNSNNEKLIKAIICAGLYPNVAQIKPGRRRPDTQKPIILQSNTDRKIRFHPKSINSSEFEFDYSWFIYHLKMKTSNIYLYDCTMVSPYPLLFFGGSVNVRKDHGQDCIVVDDWIIFRSSRRVAHLVKELRVELDRLLEHKVRHPGVTVWDPKQKEGALMIAIMNLITTEAHKTGSVS